MPMWLAIVFALVCGALTALQSRINGQLAPRSTTRTRPPRSRSARARDPARRARVLAARPSRASVGCATALRAGRIAWWMVLGGLAGAWFVITQGLSAGRRRRRALHGRDRRRPDARRHRLRPRRAGPGRASPAHADARDRGAARARRDRVGRVGAGRARRAAPAHAAAVRRGRRRRVAAGGERPGPESPPSSALTATLANFAVGTTALVVVMLVHAASAGWP